MNPAIRALAQFLDHQLEPLLAARHRNGVEDLQQPARHLHAQFGGIAARLRAAGEHGGWMGGVIVHGEFAVTERPAGREADGQARAREEETSRDGRGRNWWPGRRAWRALRRERVPATSGPTMGFPQQPLPGGADMNNIDKLAEIVGELRSAIAEELELSASVQQGVHALTVCVGGLLRTAARSPETAALLADEISRAAEAMHAVALGFPITDDLLRQRDALLLSMLPPELRPRVTLPGLQ